MTFLAPRVRSGKLGWFGFTSGIQAKDPGWAQPKLQSANYSNATADEKRPIPAFLPSGLDGRRGHHPVEGDGGHGRTVGDVCRRPGAARGKDKWHPMGQFLSNHPKRSVHRALIRGTRVLPHPHGDELEIARERQPAMVPRR
jgi:hypothetical protein